MIHITLPDGSVKTFDEGVTPMDVARNISEGFARNVISASFNGTTIETVTPLTTDGSLVLFTWRDDAGKTAFWHSSAHVLAQAIEELYVGAKLTIGPAIENGFYYDVDFGDHSVSEKDFKAIETKMIEIARGKHDFSLRDVSKADALSLYKDNEFIETTNFYIDDLGIGGDGGVLMNIYDLWQFVDNLLSGNIVSEETLADMKNLDYGFGDYGLGFEEHDINDRVSIGHGGGIVGFNNYFTHYPERNETMLLLTNSDGNEYWGNIIGETLDVMAE